MGDTKYAGAYFYQRLLSIDGETEVELTHFVELR